MHFYHDAGGGYNVFVLSQAKINETSYISLTKGTRCDSTAPLIGVES